ncbi:chorismate mutase [Streptomyces marispadix]|uniref:Chorismate mutase n=1 Tax=Streptomyces marispadix TaxID=2922868 RepID=A0ABS9T117_9ACTN|nr:chorismate mutase [Streptomyces marispadix]MCH6162128.1 chorismate mutase [Streptomyces marispadix]
MDTVNATTTTDTASSPDAASIPDATGAGSTASTASPASTGGTGSTASAADVNGSTADGAATGDATGARSRIDELDARIIALVQERRAVSAGIQRARIEAGGRRVHLAREMEILDRYRGELGRPGTQLAMTLLALCRGAL